MLKKRCLIVSHEPLLSSSIELFFNDYNNKDFVRATENFLLHLCLMQVLNVIIGMK